MRPGEPVPPFDELDEITAPAEPASRAALLKQGAVYWAGRMGARCVSVFLLPIYTRYIPPAQWGFLALLSITGELAILVGALQLPVALFRNWALAPDETERRRLFGIALTVPALVSTALLLPVYFAAGPIAHWLEAPGFGNTIRLYAVSVQLAILVGVLQAEMRLRDETRLYALLDTGLQFAQAALNVLFIVGFGLGVRGMVLGQLVAFGGTFALIAPRALRRSLPNLDRGRLARLLHFSLPLVPSAALMAGVNNIDRYFVQALRGAEETGIYSMGYKFGTMVSLLILGPFLLMWDPKSYELARRADGPQRVGEVFAWIAAALLFVALGLSVASREIVQLMTSRDYWGAAIVIPPVAASYVLFGVDCVSRLGLLLHGRTKTVLGIVSVAFVVNVALNALLIPAWGMVGAAWATLAAFAVLFVLDLVLARRWFAIEWPWRRLLLLAVASLVAGGAAWCVRFDRAWPGFIAKGFAMLLFPLVLFAGGFFGDPRRILRGRRPGRSA